MNEQNQERLSALMDGELSPTQTRQLLEAMKKDTELRKFWHSGHIITAAIHGEAVANPSPSLADSVREALVSEPALVAPAPIRQRRSLGPLGGLALAASVAMLAVIATQQALLDRQNLAPRLEGRGSEIASAPASKAQLASSKVTSNQLPVSAQLQQQQNDEQNVALTRMTWNDAGPGVEARLNAYLLNHNEYMVGGLHGMLPYARVVGYGQTK